MAKLDYSEFVADAIELIDEFGQTIVVRKPGEAQGDLWNPTIGEPTYSTTAAVELEYEDDDIDGTLIQRTDKKLIVDPTVSISTEDTIALGVVGNEYDAATFFEVINVKPLAPAGIVILYEVQIRR